MQWQGSANAQQLELPQSPDPDALALQLLALEATTQHAAPSEGGPEQPEDAVLAADALLSADAVLSGMQASHVQRRLS